MTKMLRFIELADYVWHYGPPSEFDSVYDEITNVTICHFFPEGAELLTFPSAFTRHTGRAHWESLLRARAIENQCYVIAAAQVTPW